MFVSTKYEVDERVAFFISRKYNSKRRFYMTYIIFFIAY